MRQEQIPTDQLAGRSPAEEVAGRSHLAGVAVPIGLGEEGRHTDLVERAMRTGLVERALPSPPVGHHEAAVQAEVEEHHTDLVVVRILVVEVEVDIQTAHRSPAVEDSCFLEEELPRIAGEAGRYIAPVVVDSILVGVAAVRILLAARTSECVYLLLFRWARISGLQRSFTAARGKSYCVVRSGG